VSARLRLHAELVACTHWLEASDELLQLDAATLVADVSPIHALGGYQPVATTTLEAKP
jgi:hypothetical protein